MAATVFPGAGVFPLKAGFSDEPGEGYVAFASDKTGAEKRRAVTTKAPGKMAFSMVLTASQVAGLTGQYVTTCKHGTLRFDWTHPITGVDIEAQFTAAPKITDRSNVPRYTGSVQLKYWLVS